MPTHPLRRPFRHLARTVLCLALVCTTPISVWADTEASRPENSELPQTPEKHPLNFRFDASSKGKAAFEKIKKANKQREFAERYKVKEAEIEQFLNRLEKEGGKLDPDGNVYIEEDIGFASKDTNITKDVLPTLPNITDDQTFKLHSRPSSKRKIYLDFRGETVTNSTWNNVSGRATLNHPPFDLDGVPGTFSTTELKTIQAIWHRVSDSFSAFDVDVTTEEPSYDALTRSSSTDDTYGMRVVITRSFTYANGSSCNCVGIAYLGAMDSIRTPGAMSLQPAYLFYDRLGSVSAWSGTITHELGHTLGLLHDGDATTAYYPGHGFANWETSWTSIMGNSRETNLKHWSKGEYPGANNKQDDYLVMQSNGLSFATDDRGNTPETATLLVNQASNAGEFLGNGVINGPTDIDFFKVNLSAGYMEVSMLPGVGYTLDPLVKIYNGQKQIIRQINPANRLYPTGGVSIPTAGTYYVSIEGTGRAAVSGDPGYSRYGSIGNYAFKVRAQKLTGNAPPTVGLISSASSGVNPAPFTFTARGTDPEGFALKYTWDFGDGTQGSGREVQHTYTASGSFKVSVTATDVMGLQDAESTTVKVVDQSSLPALTLTDVSLYTLTDPYKGMLNKSVVAVPKVVDSKGVGVKDVQITGEWGGVMSSTCTMRTDVNGTAFCYSDLTEASGTWTFKITSISKQGYRIVAPPALMLKSVTF